MNDLISREAAMKCLEGLDALMRHRAETEDKGFLAVQAGITLAHCEIEALPVVDAVVLEHAAWKACCEGREVPKVCSNCNWATWAHSYYAFCPNCGARMDADHLVDANKKDADAPERGGEDLNG